MATAPKPLPDPLLMPVSHVTGAPNPLTASLTREWAQYFLSADMLLRAIAAGKIGPLTNAANDAAAATAGVAVNGLYHNAGAVRIRLI